jgi:hypothetical protein
MCHTRTEQQFHPDIYKSTKCHDMQQTGYCPRGPFCAFAHVEQVDEDAEISGPGKMRIRTSSDAQFELARYKNIALYFATDCKIDSAEETSSKRGTCVTTRQLERKDAQELSHFLISGTMPTGRSRRRKYRTGGGHPRRCQDHKDSRRINRHRATFQSRKYGTVIPA